MEQEFYFKEEHRFLLHGNFAYRNYTLMDKCVIQVMQKNPPQEAVWFAMNIGNGIPCFKGTGLTKEEALENLFLDMRDFYLKETEHSTRMLNFVSNVLKS
jgi:hypothetical protein